MFIWKYIFYHPFLKDIFIWYKILRGWFFYFFHNLKMAFYFLLPSIVYKEKSVIICIISSICKASIFSVFFVFFLCLHFSSWIIIGLSVVFFIFILPETYWDSVIWEVVFFITLCKLSRNILSDISFYPIFLFQCSSYMYILPLTLSLRLCSFYSSFFSLFLKMDYFYSSFFKSSAFFFYNLQYAVKHI